MGKTVGVTWVEITSQEYSCKEPMVSEARIVDILAKNAKDLEIDQVSEGITRFGGHPLVVLLDGKETSLWCEFIRVDKGTNQSMAFRVLTRMGKNGENGAEAIKGVRHYLEKKSKKSRAVILDHRSNIEREIEPGTPRSGSTQSRDLLNAYRGLLQKEFDVLLTPIREGALGSDEKIDQIGPYAEKSAKNDPKVWDISEEIQMARNYQLIFSGIANPRALEVFRGQIVSQYREFALPLAQMLHSELKLMSLQELPADVSAMVTNADITFFDDEVVTKEIDLGFGQKRVERVISYPYPTEHGIVYTTLFRIWNVEDKRFEVVRVLQSQPQLSRIDGLRIDSSCVDGVHSLDCHCDCKAQLEQALYDEGLDKGKNVVIIQMADHEGKGHGSVLKGHLTHRPVREHNAEFPDDPLCHVEVADVAYNALGVPPDNRTYGSAQAVVLFLEIEYVEELFMDNRDKVNSLEGVGLRYGRKRPLYAQESKLTREANLVNDAKKQGKVTGPNGEPVIYNGKVETR